MVKRIAWHVAAALFARLRAAGATSESNDGARLLVAVGGSGQLLRWAMVAFFVVLHALLQRALCRMKDAGMPCDPRSRGSVRILAFGHAVDREVWPRIRVFKHMCRADPVLG